MRRLFYLLSLLALPGTTFAQNRLQRAAGVRHPKPWVAPAPAPQPAPNTLQPRNNTTPAPGGSPEGLGYLAALAVAGPFVLPHLAMEDDLKNPGFFPHYPYENGRKGYLWPQDGGGTPDEFRPVAVRASVEDGNDFQGLNRVGAKVYAEACNRFGAQLRGHFYQEDVSPGRSDELFLGSAELTYRFAQSEKAEFFAGAGARVSDHDLRTRYGFNFTYGGDLYLMKPVVLSFAFDLGNLGKDFVFNARATAGLIFRRYEFFVGYDYLLIGPVELQGATAGFRLWF